LTSQDLTFLTFVSVLVRFDELPIASWAKKKPAWWNTRQVFHHAGLLINKPSSSAGLPFD
jgi:hypothetical protein